MLSFSDVFDLEFTFDLRRFKVNRTAEQLEQEGLLPSPKNEVVRAILENAETDEDLRNYFKNKKYPINL